MKTKHSKRKWGRERQSNIPFVMQNFYPLQHDRCHCWLNLHWISYTSTSGPFLLDFSSLRSRCVLYLYFWYANYGLRATNGNEFTFAQYTTTHYYTTIIAATALDLMKKFSRKLVLFNKLPTRYIFPLHYKTKWLVAQSITKICTNYYDSEYFVPLHLFIRTTLSLKLCSSLNVNELLLTNCDGNQQRWLLKPASVTWESARLDNEHYVYNFSLAK